MLFLSSGDPAAWMEIQPQVSQVGPKGWPSKFEHNNNNFIR